jgi:uncharacterized protein
MDFASHEDRIAEAARRLAAAAPDAKVILIGSHARGSARPDSDLDLLVIEPEVKSRRAEYVRLREALGNLGVPIDSVVLPVSPSKNGATSRARCSVTLCARAVFSSRQREKNQTGLRSSRLRVLPAER